MSRFTYIYILQSEIDSERFYIGRTRDLRGRLSSHNAGNVRYTRRWKPCRVKTYIAVLDPERGVALERYFKSSAGGCSSKSASNILRTGAREEISDCGIRNADLNGACGGASR